MWYGKEENLFFQLMIVSEYLSDMFCWAVGGIWYLHKKESCIRLEVTSEIGKEPQFKLMYGM